MPRAVVVPTETVLRPRLGPEIQEMLAHAPSSKPTAKDAMMQSPGSLRRDKKTTRTKRYNAGKGRKARIKGNPKIEKTQIKSKGKR
jgi:hypothetical protein